ncbi:ergosterol biosynthesis ERG4/ERG24 family-domain-containing protein [Phlyctochytrium arcticum]|nr:ergosterol biosynthesis ERG4/ERG24 family-domain-containing protein [Phlyctochytrium arcticum]
MSSRASRAGRKTAASSSSNSKETVSKPQNTPSTTRARRGSPSSSAASSDAEDTSRRASTVASRAKNVAKAVGRAVREGSIELAQHLREGSTGIDTGDDDESATGTGQDDASLLGDFITESELETDNERFVAATQPRTTHFEFMGPHGPALIMMALPPATLFLQVLCDPDYGCPPAQFWKEPIEYLKYRIEDTTFFTFQAFFVVIGWIIFQMLLHGYLPGNFVKGTPLSNGKRLTYKINGFICMVATYLGLYALFATQGLRPFLWVSRNTTQLATAACLVAIVKSCFLYAMSFRIPQSGQVMLAKGGNSGYPVYDFWIGRELNPRLWGWFDLKYFCELRPGLIGWSVLNLSLMTRQYVELDRRISPSMFIVVFSQIYYVADALWNEPAILTTMDITTDGFGFMLAFGDLAWVPFTYSLQAMYLVSDPVKLSTFGLFGLVALQLFGIYIFRSANSEKDAFKRNPNAPILRHLDFIQTPSGTKLLCSGWWGLARHINYFGDWLMALAWCMCTGFRSPIPYFYAFYFAILLIHRNMRDDYKCSMKYGASWQEYKRRVPYAIVPGIY